MNFKFNDLENLIKGQETNIQEEFDKLKGYAEEYMDKVCSNEVLLKLQEYEQVAKSFSQFFS